MKLIPICKKALLLAALVPVFSFAYSANSTDNDSATTQSIVAEREYRDAAGRPQHYENHPGTPPAYSQSRQNEPHNNNNTYENQSKNINNFEEPGHGANSYGNQSNLKQDSRAYNAGMDNGANNGGGGVLVDPNALNPITYPPYPTQTNYQQPNQQPIYPTPPPISN